MHIALVSRVEDDRIAGRIEDPVNPDGQFHGAQVGAEVPAGAAHVGDQERANLAGEERQLARR